MQHVPRDAKVLAQVTLEQGYVRPGSDTPGPSLDLPLSITPDLSLLVSCRPRIWAGRSCEVLTKEGSYDSLKVSKLVRI